MKILNIIVAFTIIGFAMLSCDKIEAPYKEISDKPVDTTDQIVKKVLLEDYTGHKCVNCPSAHDVAHELQDIYGDDNLIVVAIHAGFFATPSGTPYDYDFQTEAGTDYNTFFSVQSNPIGMINRINDGGNYLLDTGKWGTEANKEFDLDAELGIEITCDLQSDKLNGEINFNFASSINQAISLQIWIIEDNIIKAQLAPGGVIEDYVHNNVLRGAVNGNWGEALASAYSIGDTGTVSFSNYQLGDDWVSSELSIVAFIYEVESKRVLQVEKKKIIE